MSLTLVPCEHYWLECRTRPGQIVAVCKFCKKRGEFNEAEWLGLANMGQAINKPVRV